MLFLMHLFYVMSLFCFLSQASQLPSSCDPASLSLLFPFVFQFSNPGLKLGNILDSCFERGIQIFVHVLKILHGFM